MANLIFSILSEYNGKGLAKGKKDLTAFEKQTKQLGKTFAKYLGAAALVSFGKKAVNAFAADEAAAKALEIQLKNTGFAFASPYVENYIAGLQKLTGVLDDNLRPAFQSLLTSTRSITLSQNALNVALDTSAATGMSLQEVTSTIVRGYNGQTKGLKNLGVALSKTALKTGNMEIALKELQKAYAGQAAARLQTYAGKMDLLKVAAADATEIIGKGLINAFTALGKDNSIADTTKKIETLATAIGNLIAGLGVLASKLDDIGSNTGLAKVVKFLFEGTPLDLLIKAGAAAAPAAPNVGGYSGIPSVQERIRAQELIARKKLVDAIKAEEALKKLKDKYDLERVGLMAALNAATDLETKTRLSEKLAILDGNAALAKKYLADNLAADSALRFANAANEAGTMLVDGAAAAFARLALYDPVRAYGATNMGSTNAMSNVPSAGVSSFVGTPFGQAGGNTGPVNVTLELAPNAGEFGQLIYNSFLINQRDGKSQLYNGGIKGG
jgi:hypothetical protein